MDRMLRVNELLRREIGLYLERELAQELGCLVTVTDVRTAPDLRHAQVYVSVYGEQDRERVMALLHKRRREIQRTISKSIKIKYTPVLEFRLDDRMAEGDRILQLLAQLEEEEGPADEEEPDA